MNVPLLVNKVSSGWEADPGLNFAGLKIDPNGFGTNGANFGISSDNAFVAESLGL